MPNKRSASKKIVSTYVEQELKQRLLKIAELEGKTLTELVTELIEERVSANANHRRPAK